MTGPDPIDYGWWLASRSAGVVAYLGVSLSVLAGLLMANNLPRRRGAKKRLLALHESAALAGLAAIAAHGLLLLGDGWLKPGIAGIAIPFTMGYRPEFTGLGIAAGWTLAILGPSFYVRRRVGATPLAPDPSLDDRRLGARRRPRARRRHRRRPVVASGDHRRDGGADRRAVRAARVHAGASAAPAVDRRPALRPGTRLPRSARRASAA